MLRYGQGGFGRQAVSHQNRMGKEGAKFLRHLGFGARAARNFRFAAALHDIGKIDPFYDPALWTLEDRPTPEQKALQKLHARLGAEWLEKLAEGMPGLRDHPHFAVRHAITLYHHERADGRGPEGVEAASLPLFVQVACIVDAYDGDLIPRPHQASRRTPREELARLQGRGTDKYDGAFDPQLLAAFVAMKERELA